MTKWLARNNVMLIGEALPGALDSAWLSKPEVVHLESGLVRALPSHRGTEPGRNGGATSSAAPGTETAPYTPGWYPDPSSHARSSSSLPRKGTSGSTATRRCDPWSITSRSSRCARASGPGRTTTSSVHGDTLITRRSERRGAKWLKIIFAMWQRRVPYDEQYHLATMTRQELRRRQKEKSPDAAGSNSNASFAKPGEARVNATRVTSESDSHGAFADAPANRWPSRERGGPDSRPGRAHR